MGALTSLPGAKRLNKLPPERLPRRAVQGLGAHSPHQTSRTGTYKTTTSLELNRQKSCE